MNGSVRDPQIWQLSGACYTNHGVNPSGIVVDIDVITAGNERGGNASLALVLRMDDRHLSCDLGVRVQLEISSSFEEQTNQFFSC